MRPELRLQRMTEKIKGHPNVLKQVQKRKFDYGCWPWTGAILPAEIITHKVSLAKNRTQTQLKPERPITTVAGRRVKVIRWLWAYERPP